MTLKAVSAALEVNNAVDTYQTAIGKVYDVLDDLYDEVNLLYRMTYGAVAPTSAENGLLWLDGSTTPPVLKYNAGGSGTEDWQTVAASASFGSSLGFDAAFTGYSDRMILTKNGTSVEVVATAALPATLFIVDQNAGMVQNTSSAIVAISGTAGIYDIWAQRDGSNLTFTLDFEATGVTPSGNNAEYGQRKIGEIYWDGSSITALRSLELDDKTKYATPNQLFYAYTDTDSTAQALNDGVLTTLTMRETYYDPDNCENLGVFTAQRAGFYEFGASVKISKDACTSLELELALYRNGVGNPVASNSNKSTAGTSSTLTVKTTLASGPVYIPVGGTITIRATQDNNASSPNITDAAADVTNATKRHDFGWWGRYLGP